MKIILILLVMVAVQGCQQHSSSERTSSANKVITIYTLLDGTKCAVYRLHNAGGISCDWKRGK